MALALAACTANGAVEPNAPSSTTEPPLTTTMPTSALTTMPGTSTTTRSVTEEEKAWLHDELVRFIDDIEDSGLVAGPAVAYSELECMGRAIGSTSAQGGDLSDERDWGSVRWFLADRSERGVMGRSQPEDSQLHPDWKPTHWAVATVLTFEDEDWRSLSRQGMAEAVVKVEAASFTVEPVRRPEVCSLVEKVDLTDRFGPLLPRAFEMLPTG